MNSIYNILKELILEQNGKITDLEKAINDKLPVSIYYSGPPKEVLSGQRIDILPVVMGPHIKTGNLIIWAYVFKGISKKGIPNWKMFRVDRIKSIKFNTNLTPFDLNDLPGYDEDKILKSIRSEIPYTKEKPEVEPVAPPIEPVAPPEVEPPKVEPVEPEITQPQPAPNKEPKMTSNILRNTIYNALKDKSTEITGTKVINKNDYESAVNSLSKAKEDEFKAYQKMISGNIRPGEGTRKRFTDTAKNEIDRLLSKDNIIIANETPENIAEIFKRFKDLIK